jgi:hypothetical protein
MTQFEFVLVFVSIVIAFAVTDILANWGEQIRLRHQIRHYVLHTAWSVLLLFVMMQVWWSLWQLSERTGWTFPEYLALVVPFLTLALMAYILTPKLDEPGKDIRSHYFDNSRWFFSYVVIGKPINEPGSPYRFAGIMLMLVLASWRNERVHVVTLVLAYFLMAAWLAAVVI